MYPITEASGVRSSWLAFAMKSERSCSARRVSVRSSIWAMARASGPKAPSTGSIPRRASKKRSRPWWVGKRTQRSSPSASVAVSASTKAGARMTLAKCASGWNRGSAACAAGLA